MKKSFVILGLLFSLLALPALPQAPSAKRAALVLTHVTVIDTTGGPAQPDNTVVIRGDRIAAIGKSGEIRVPPGSEIIEGAGKFLIPGLWDMDAYFYERKYLPLFISNGVTGIREMLGYAEHYEFRKEIEAGQLLGPHMVIASRWLEGPKEIEPYFITVAGESDARNAVVDAQKYGADFIEIGGAETLTREAFFTVAAEAKKQGIPFEGHVPVSVTVGEASNAGMRSIDPEPQQFELIDVETLAACSARETDLLKTWQDALAKHGDSEEGFWTIPGFLTGLQVALDTYDQQKAEQLFALLKANHTWFSPALVAQRNFVFFDDPLIANDVRLKYLSAGERAWFEGGKKRLSESSPEYRVLRKAVYQKYLQIVGAMRRAGDDFLAGTIAEEPIFNIPGFSLHDELGLLVEAGFTPLEALQTATLNPARFLGKEQDFGTAAPGKFADLVLLDGSPLQDISNTRKIAAVVYGGKLYARASLDAMLVRIEELARRKSIRDELEPIIKKQGVEAAIRKYRELRRGQPNAYDFEDDEQLYSLARPLLKEKKFKEAIELIKLNIEAGANFLWWSYDDLGDAYVQAGEKDLAIQAYRQSLHLDPAQTYAGMKLKQLNSQ